MEKSCDFGSNSMYKLSNSMFINCYGQFGSFEKSSTAFGLK
jgi:hypothetical protein